MQRPPRAGGRSSASSPSCSSVNGVMIYSALSTHIGPRRQRALSQGPRTTTSASRPTSARHASAGSDDARRSAATAACAAGRSTTRRPRRRAACSVDGVARPARRPTATTSSSQLAETAPGRYEAQTAPLAPRAPGSSRSRRVSDARAPRTRLSHAEAPMAQALSAATQPLGRACSAAVPRDATHRGDDDARRREHALRRLHAQGRGARSRPSPASPARAPTCRPGASPPCIDAGRRQRGRPRRGARPRRLQGGRARRRRAIRRSRADQRFPASASASPASPPPTSCCCRCRSGRARPAT